MPLIIRPTFDATQAEQQFNTWLAGLAGKANIPVKPQLPPGDPTGPLVTGGEKARAKFEELSAELDRFLKKADFNASAASLDQLRERASRTEAEFAKARAELDIFRKSLSGVDLSQLDADWVAAYNDQLKKLGTNAKQSFGDAQQAAKDYQQALDRLNKTSVVEGGGATDEKLTQLVDISKFEAMRSWFSDLRDVFDITTQSLLGFTDVQAQAASQAAYLAEKGLTLGIAFGPLAAVFGGIIGVTLSMAHYWIESQKEINRLNDAVKDASKEFRVWLQTMEAFGQFDAGSGARALIKEFDALQAKIKEDTGILDWLKKNTVSLESWALALGVNGSQLSNVILQTEQWKNKLTELQQQQLSLQATQWYGAAAKEAQDLVEKIDKTIASADKLGRQKSFKDLEEESKKAGEKLKTARDEAEQLYINLSVLKSNTKGKILSEQDKKDLQEAETLFDAASKAASHWLGVFIGAKTAENQFKDNASQKRVEKINQETAALTELLRIAKEGHDERVEAGDLLDKDGLKETRDEMESLNREILDLLAGADAMREEPLLDVDGLHERIEFTREELDKLNEDLETTFAENLRNSLGISIEAAEELANSLENIGASAASAIGGAAAGAFKELFDALATGEKMNESFARSFTRKAAEGLRATGSELIGDGIANGLKALAMAFIPGLQGNAAGLALAGAAEIAAGAAMGGVGILGGRAAGPAPETSSSGGSGSGGRGAGGSTGGTRSEFETQMQNPIIMNLTGVPFGVLSEREMTAIGERVVKTAETFKSNGGLSFPS